MKTRRVECTVDCPVCEQPIYTVWATEDSSRPGFWNNERVPNDPTALCKTCGVLGDRVEPSKMIARIREVID